MEEKPKGQQEELSSLLIKRKARESSLQRNSHYYFFCFCSKDHLNRRIYSFKLEVSVIRKTVQASYLKLVMQTERIPASAAARHAIGTTSEICFIKMSA